MIPQAKSLLKKTLLLGFGAFTLAASYKYSPYFKKTPKTPSSMRDTLDYYGFNKIHQKQSLERIMQISGLLKPTDSFNDLFPPRNDNDLLLEDIAHFVELTQKHFTIRTGTQERWEVDPLTWMENNKEKIILDLKNLGFIDAVKPTSSNVHMVCGLGARTIAMQERIDHFAQLYNSSELNTRYLVLLVGERKVTIGSDIDGTKQELASIAEKRNLPIEALTETHMMEKIYAESNIFGKIPTDIIDTPAGDLPRPTTVTTMQALCKWLQKHPDVQEVIFVSSQPHVMYQDDVIRLVLQQEGVTIKFQVIGPQISPKAKIQDLVGALGSHIYAATPAVIQKAHLTIADPATMEKLHQIYGKQPLIYNQVEKLFKPTEEPPNTMNGKHNNGNKK